LWLDDGLSGNYPVVPVKSPVSGKFVTKLPITPRFCRSSP
jgi:hypothetical protein